MATPSRQEHETISRILTGTPATPVHQALDLPHLLTLHKKHLPNLDTETLYRSLRQPNNPYTSGHRQAFHTPEEALLMGYLIDGNRGSYNALIHILADQLFNTKDSKQLLKLLNKRK